MPRVSDEGLKWLIEQTEKHSCLIIANVGHAFLDLRDLRAAASEAVMAWDKEDILNHIDWLEEVESAIDKLREAIGG